LPVYLCTADLEGRRVRTVEAGMNMKKKMIKVPLMCRGFWISVLFSRKSEKTESCKCTFEPHPL